MLRALLLTIGVCLTFGLALVPSALASGQLTANFEGPRDMWLGMSDGWMAQTFTAEVAGPVTTAEMQIYWWTASQPPQVSITAVDASGQPTGAALASATVTTPAPTDPSFVSVDFADHPQLTKGARYALVVWFPAGGSWGHSTMNDYPGGVAYDGYGSTLSSVYWYNLDDEGILHDFLFRVYVQSDSTAPLITITTPADGAFYKMGASVVAAYTCDDGAGGSGVASCTGTVANGAAIDTATAGSHAFTVNATDNAGNPASTTVHYTVDGTAPSITITSPTGGAIYPLGGSVLAGFVCADEPGGSGLASCVGTVPSGSAIATSVAGSFTFAVTAKDTVGNEATKSVSYKVEDARALIVDLKTSGAVKANLADSAIKLLDQAAAKAAAGQKSAAISIYTQVKGQVDSWVKSQKLPQQQHDDVITAINFAIAQLS